MLFSKNGIIRLIYTVIVSIIICISSAKIFFNINAPTELIIKSVLLGTIIWFLSEILFEVVYKIWPYKILPRYIVIIILIAIGTGVGSYLLGVKSLLYIILICLCGEICGLVITIIYQRYYQRILNNHLEEFKNNN